MGHFSTPALEVGVEQKQINRQTNTESVTPSSTKALPIVDQNSNVNNSIDLGNNENNFTEDSLKSIFEKIFDTYGIEYDINIIIKISAHASTKEELLSLPKNRVENEIKECLVKAFEKHYNKLTKKLDTDAAIETAKKYNIAQATGWTIDEFEKAQANNGSEIKNIKDAINAIAKKNNKEFDINNATRDELKKYILELFKENLEQYKKAGDIKQAQEMAIKDFGILLANTADEDKELLLPIVLEVIEDDAQLKLYFKSFRSKNIKSSVLGSIKYTDIKELNSCKRIEVIRNMSERDVIATVEEFKRDQSSYYKEHQVEIEALLSKNKSEYTDEDYILLQRITFFTQFGSDTTIATSCNYDITDENKNKIIDDIVQFEKESPTYQLYLESLANTLYNNPNLSSDIQRNEIKELLDTITDNKFSQVVDNMPELSAVDKETGFYKTPTAEQKSAGIDYLNYLRETTLNNTSSDREQQSFEIVKDDTSEVKTSSSSQTSSGNVYKVTDIIEIITGKKSNITKKEEDDAVEGYKLLNTAIQGNLLRRASGSLFNKLLENTKTLTLKLLLATGWKGKSFAETQKVRETIENRKEENAG